MTNIYPCRKVHVKVIVQEKPSVDIVAVFRLCRIPFGQLGGSTKHLYRNTKMGVAFLAEFFHFIPYIFTHIPSRRIIIYMI